ncbi:IS3 family transposase [Actinomycetospora cinnamomea]
MPAPHPPEFRRRAVELARKGGEQPVAAIAKDLGISESCLRNWMAQADADDGTNTDRLTSKERAELAELRKDKRRLEVEKEILKRAAAYFARENVLPKLVFPLVRELADDGFDVAVTCRVLNVRRQGYYEWLAGAKSARAQENELLLKHIEKIHEESRDTYGWPRVHAELTLGLGLAVNHKRVARLMREAGIQGLYRRRHRGCTVRDPVADPYPDLVERRFNVEAPDQLWLTDITEHGTDEGKLYCAAVLDAYSRRIIGWSIDDNMRTALVTDALGMAITRRRPTPANSTIMHSDHGSQFTSWAFGQRLQAAGLLGSMGSIGDCYDNSMMESFWGTMQLELLDARTWKTRAELANAIFEWIECWYNPKRRHSSIEMLSPLDYEARHTRPSQDH